MILPVIGLLALSAVTDAQEQSSAVEAETPLQVHVSDTTVHLDLNDAHDIRFSHLSMSQGLSQTRVMRVVQDDQGFLWFATQYGLNRYDGYRFKVFKHDPSAPSSICGVYIRSLFKDRAGTLWVGCDYALDRYDPTRESFVHYRIDPDLRGQIVTIRHISQDGAGLLWLSTPNGLYRFDPRSGQTTRFGHNSGDLGSLSSDAVYSAGEDRAGEFWVATSEGLDEFDTATGRVRRHVPIHETREMSFYEDRSGVIWIIYSSGNGLATLDRSTGQLTRYSFAPRDSPDQALTGVSAMLEDRSGTLWLGTFADGLLRFDREHQRFTRFRTEPTDPESIGEDRITALSEDREGTIWVGLGATEPSFFPTAHPSFMKLPFDWQNRDNLGERLVNAIYQDKQGFLWIGTTGGLSRIDRSTGQYVHFKRARPPATCSRSLKTIQELSGLVRPAKAWLVWIGARGASQRIVTSREIPRALATTPCRTYWWMRKEDYGR